MLEKINSIVWSDFLLFLLLGTGLIISIRLKFFQIFRFPYILKKTFFSLFRDKSTRKSSDRGVSQFQSLSTALAATMGTGNIVGVATAITTGGAGAVFWMWISAILGMGLVYAENYLGTLYRRKNNKNDITSGTIAFLEYGTGRKYLAVLFCIFCSLASLGMGNMTQINSVSHALDRSFDIPPVYTGLFFAGLVMLIICGSIKRIGSVSQILIPVLSLIYMGTAVLIIINNRALLPQTFEDIFRGAFGINAVGGGVCGEIIRKSINTGLRRGVFSNEAGLGSSSLLHSGTENPDPQRQGLWAIFEVFADTIICCTLTALAILTSGALSSGETGISLAVRTFECVMGDFSDIFMSVSITLFAFATIISWYFCGECCIKYIFGRNGIAFYRIIFGFCIIVGAYSELESVWVLSDIFNGLMAFPNLAGLFILRKNVKFHKTE
ncbi:MAG: sodium:alanine symporter family protein [Oscillospiraceae bacterium]|nr:sodium:alanine symporter family protein [Oscillospiraceae bacterium]